MDGVVGRFDVGGDLALPVVVSARDGLYSGASFKIYFAGRRVVNVERCTVLQESVLSENQFGRFSMCLCLCGIVRLRTDVGILTTILYEGLRLRVGAHDCTLGFCIFCINVSSVSCSRGSATSLVDIS